MKNKLTHETSPYLLQHADNPVYWFAWGEEAFEQARKLNRPIFLSIGYSTCHWCHVMAHESFENETIADILNENFISIKVDRETRPDIDAVYMNVCQSLTGSGGWPMSIFMTPDKVPFFAGTYFPPQPRYGQPGFGDLLLAIARQWHSDRKELIRVGNEITAQLRNKQDTTTAGEPEDLTLSIADQAFSELRQTFDRQYGGFGTAPKFPAPHILLFLLKYYQSGGHQTALAMAESTFRAMYQGGLYDHVGGGFSRYSTDQKWLVPHFEKMLYDNAMLTLAYCEAYRITSDQNYRYIIETTLGYIEAEMTSPENGFYSAQDADSEGEEGKYYTWSLEEIKAILGTENSLYFCRQYDISRNGNFEGKNIPNRLGEQELIIPDTKTKALLKQLKIHRASRFQLHKDDKILTAWNAMMITAYARAGKVLECSDYLETAQKAIRYIEDNLITDKNTLYISRSKNQSAGDGTLDDYAYLLLAYLELYDSTYEPIWLKKGIDIGNHILTLFADPAGGLFMSSEHAEELLYRPKEYYDGAIPSGNSAAAYGFARLWTLTEDSLWEHNAAKQLAAFPGVFQYGPSAYAFALTALLEWLSPQRQLVAVFTDELRSNQFISAIKTLNTTGLAIHVINKDTAEGMIALRPDLADYWSAVKGPETYYLCQNHSCLPPFDNPGDILGTLTG